MSELSLLKKGGGDAEGLHVAQADFTCWIYGEYRPHYWYQVTPTYRTIDAVATWFNQNTATLYDSLSLSNGIVVLSGAHPGTERATGWTYYRDSFYRIYGKTNGWNCYSEYYDGIYPPQWKDKAGWAFSKDSSRYPSSPEDGISPDGFYYEKIELS